MSKLSLAGYAKLDQFGQEIFDIFGERAYLVGSATTSSDWNDIDVRLILETPQLRKWIGKGFTNRYNRRWAALCLAFTARGKEITGLPIDFQIQSMKQANIKYDRGKREPLGMTIGEQ